MILCVNSMNDIESLGVVFYNSIKFIKFISYLKFKKIVLKFLKQLNNTWIIKVIKNNYLTLLY